MSMVIHQTQTWSEWQIFLKRRMEVAGLFITFVITYFLTAMLSPGSLLTNLKWLLFCF